METSLYKFHVCGFLNEGGYRDKCNTIVYASTQQEVIKKFKEALGRPNIQPEVSPSFEEILR